MHCCGGNAESVTSVGMEGLQKVQQTGSARGDLAKFNNAVADCVCITPEDKLKHFLGGPRPEIRRLADACWPGICQELSD